MTLTGQGNLKEWWTTFPPFRNGGKVFIQLTFYVAHLPVINAVNPKYPKPGEITKDIAYCLKVGLMGSNLTVSSGSVPLRKIYDLTSVGLESTNSTLEIWSERISGRWLDMIWIRSRFHPRRLQLRRVRVSKLERSRALMATSGAVSAASQLTIAARRLLISLMTGTLCPLPAKYCSFGRLRVGKMSSDRTEVSSCGETCR